MKTVPVPTVAVIIAAIAAAHALARGVRAQAPSILIDTTGPANQQEFGEFIDSFFEAEMARSHVPGAVFLLVKNGDVFYASGYGFAHLEDRTPVDPQRTVFRVGSISKSLTAAAVLTLVDEGHLDLDADVNEYLEHARVPPTFSEPVTLRHLLTHTAGFDERLFGQHARSRSDALSLEEYLAIHLPPRTGPPGEVISYNDHGTSLAGLVVEDVSGRPFAQYVAERILAPLGMGSSSFDVLNLPPQIQDNLATAYRYWAGEHEPYRYDYIQTAPAAGLVATAADMGRFLSALLDGGRQGDRRILSDSMTAIMLDRQFAHSPQLPGRAFGFAESNENGVRALIKNGQATGFLSRIVLIPQAKVGFFSSINLSIFAPGPSFNRASGFHRRLTTAILDRYFMPDTSYFAIPTAPAPNPSFDPSPYVGTYRSMEGSRHTIEKITFLGTETAVRDAGDGTLRVGGARYVMLEPGLFQYADGGPHYLAFALDAGRATHLFIGAGAEERVPWYETMRTATGVLIGAAALFLSALIVPVAGRIVPQRGRTAESRHPGWAILVAAVALCLAFIVGFGWAFSQADFQEFFKGVPSIIAVLLVLPVVATVLTVLSVVNSIRAWRHELGSLVGRIYFSVVTAGLTVFLFFLNNWYLLGWRW